MTNREHATELRKQGLTYREIAEILGVSKQRVAQYFTDIANKPLYYRPFRSIFSGLNEFMNEREYGVTWLVVHMGYSQSGNKQAQLKNKLAGRTEFKLSEIKKVLSATGMTFEECFGEVAE